MSGEGGGGGVCGVWFSKEKAHLAYNKPCSLHFVLLLLLRGLGLAQQYRKYGSRVEVDPASAPGTDLLDLVQVSFTVNSFYGGQGRRLSLLRFQRGRDFPAQALFVYETKTHTCT